MEEENYQQPIQLAHTSEGALQYQLENAPNINKIRNIILGKRQVFNSETGKFEWISMYPPMINSSGMDMIDGYLQTFLGNTKLFALSNLDEEYISLEVIQIGENIRSNLYDNWNRYGVKNINSASFIVRTMTSNIYAILKKGQNAKYLNFLRTTQHINETQVHQNLTQGRDKQGVLGMIFNRKKRR